MTERKVIAEIPNEVMESFSNLHQVLNARRRRPGEITTAEYLAQNFPPGTKRDTAYKELKRGQRAGLVGPPRSGVDDTGRVCILWRLIDNSGKLGD